MERTASWNETNNRRNNFDFIRFLLANAVIFTHCFNILMPSVDDEFLYRITHHQTAFATVAVNGFFVISGFLVTASWVRCSGWKDYLTRRTARIYPGYIAVVLITAFVIGPMAASDVSAYFHSIRTYTFIYRQILFHADPCLYGTFAHSHTPSLPLGSLATLRYEFWCYLLLIGFAILGMLRKRVLLLLTLMLSLVWQLGYNDLFRHVRLPFWGNVFYGYCPRVLVYFLAGVVFYLYRDVIPRSKVLFFLSIFVLVLSANTGLEWSLPVFGTYALFYLAYSQHSPFIDFGRRGDYSYGIFLYGYPIQQLIAHYWGTKLTPYTLFLTALPPTWLCAYLSWHLVEKSWLRRKKGAEQRHLPDLDTETVPMVKA